MKFNYNDVVNRLQADVVTVVFEKLDGTMRTMRCTLLPSYLPEQHRIVAAPLLTETSPEVVAVWDVEASGWRSFRLDSVRSIS